MKTPRTASDSKSKSTAASPVDEVKALATVLRDYDLTELEFENATVRIRIARGTVVPTSVSASAPSPSLSPSPPSAANSPVAQHTAAIYITSPFVGTFYRSSSPESPPFVDVGAHVRKGQVLCIIEAMKLMNEIEAEVDGTIIAVMAENGQPVEFGEPLFQIRP